MADPKTPPKTGSQKAASETAPADGAPAPEQASVESAPTAPPVESVTSPSGHWRFTGPYAAIYLPPDRVSRWIQPVDVINWGPDGPPDGHWEPTDAPTEPAPSASDDTKKE